MKDTTAVVLWAVLSTDQPLWKRRLTRLLNTDPYEHFLGGGISPQTVGRHVDRLREAELLEAQPASIEEAPRHLIVVYEPTDDARPRFEQWCEQKLRSIVLSHGEHLLQKDCTPIPDETRPLLAELVKEKFRITAEEWETLQSTAADEELYTGLLSAVTMYYFRKYLSPQLSEHPVVDALHSISDEYAETMQADIGVLTALDETSQQPN